MKDETKATLTEWATAKLATLGNTDPPDFDRIDLDEVHHTAAIMADEGDEAEYERQFKEALVEAVKNLVWKSLEALMDEIKIAFDVKLAN